MELPAFDVPEIHSPLRGSFERAYRGKDASLMCSIRLDNTIRRLQADPTIADLDELHEEVYKQAHEALDSDASQGTSNWNSMARLMTSAQFFYEQVLAPTYFSDRKTFESERRELVNGVGALPAETLQTVLNSYETATSEMESAELRGIINELTTLMLLNRRQSPNLLALPASTGDDLHNATDLYLFSYQGKDAMVTPIQVKSAHNTNLSTPNGIIIVSDRQLRGNSHNLHLAKLLTKEAESGLSRKEARTLNSVQDQLLSYIQQHPLYGAADNEAAAS